MGHIVFDFSAGQVKFPINKLEGKVDIIPSIVLDILLV